MPVTEAWKQYPLDTKVTIEIDGTFWDFESRTPQENLTLENAPTNTLEHCQDNKFGAHCIAVFFTEQTPEEIQAELDAMPPILRLAYELSHCPFAPVENDRVSLKVLQTFLEVHGVTPTNTERGLSRMQAAVLLATNSNMCALVSQEELDRFNDAVNAAISKLNPKTKPDDAAAKISAAIRGEKDEAF